MSKLGPFSIAQLDRGCAIRYEQDYAAEMGDKAAPHPPYESLSAEEKREHRRALLQILIAMGR